MSNRSSLPMVPMTDKRRAWRLFVFSAVFVVLIAIAAFFYQSLLMALVFSGLLSYLLMPLVDRLERFHVKRSWAALAILLFFMSVVGFGVWRLVPQLYHQLLVLLQLVPAALTNLAFTWLPVLERMIADSGYINSKDLHKFFENFSLLSRLDTEIKNGISGIWSTGTTLLGATIDAVFVPIITFFILKEYRRLNEFFTGLVPRDLVLPLKSFLKTINLTLRSVIKGQFMVAAILAGLYVIGFSIVGLKSAVVIGVVAGICRVIPYLDVLVGATLSGIVMLSGFGGWGQVLGVAIVIIAVQAIDGMYITPRVIGTRAGLHPIIVIVSILAFADWFHFWGVIFAIPVMAVIKVIIMAIIPFYTSSNFYQSPPAPIEDTLALKSKDS